ncbi:MAG: LarC family nickel insertion protein [Candidatus Omnitrophota bacterium]|nr:LarC family nickel insertion protein [Candidatus Omnitrophota bacterium]
MNCIYFHLVGGASGDMLVSALVDLGVPLAHLKKEYGKLGVPFMVEEKKIVHPHHVARAIRFRDKKDRTVNFSYREIIQLVAKSRLSLAVKERTQAVYKKLFEVEREIHHVGGNDFRFHHLGELDAILEICGFFISLEYLGVEKVGVSAFPLDKPSPAVRALVRDKIIQPVSLGYETVTPTAAALLCDASQGYEPFPCGKTGVGFGDAGADDYLLAYLVQDEYLHDAIIKIETNIDDMNPQIFEPVFEALYEAGAKEVYVQQVVTKKSRPAFLLNVLCDQCDFSKIRNIIFSCTSTFGIRYREYKRDKLPCIFIKKKTKLGNIRFRVARGGLRKASPEYQDCLAAAKKHNIPLIEVYRRI